MPHVPRYDNPTVPIGPAATPQATPVGAEAFGAGLARGLGSLSRDLQQIAMEQREKEQTAALNNAKIGYLQESGKALDGGPDANGTVQPGLANMSGGEANGLEAKYKPLHDRIVQDRLDGLADYPAARDQFRRWTEERYLSDATRLNRQQFEQNTKSALAAATAMQMTSIDKAVQDYQQTGAYSESDALRATHDLANLSGVPEAVRNRMVAETVSGIDRRIVEGGLNSGKPEAAKDAADFYDAVRHELTKADLSALQGPVAAYRDQEAGTRLGNDVYAAAMKDVTVNDAPPYREMIARIDSEDETDGRRNMAKAVIEDKLREYERGKRQNQEALARTVQEAPSYAEAVKLIQQAEGAVDDTARGNILDYLDRRYGIGKTENKTAPGPQRQRERKQLASLAQFQDDYLSGTSARPDARAIADRSGEFGIYTTEAVQFARNVDKDIAKAKADYEDLKQTIGMLRHNEQYRRLLPDPASGRESDKARMALLTGTTLGFSATLPAGAGKGMSPVEQAILMAPQTLGTDHGGVWDAGEPLYRQGSGAAGSRYLGAPAGWPKKVQDDFIDQQYALRNPGKTITPQVREQLRTSLLKGK